MVFRVPYVERPDEALLAAMRSEAELRFPKEACGFVIARGKKAIFMPAENTADGTDQFIIDPASYARAEDAGEVLAIWHSHPNASGTPSEADMAGCEATELTWLISPLWAGEGGFVHDDVTVMQPSGFQMPYVGRPYLFGTFDCYSLVTDYYAREFDIRLARMGHARIKQWWRHGHDIIEDNWRAQGLAPVTDGSFEPGDILTFAMDSEVANHIAVYVTGDIMIHHLVNRLSRNETLGPFWMSRLKHHFRHTSKC